MWKPIEGIQGIPDGKYKVNENGDVMSPRLQRPLKPFNSRKYKVVKLSNDNFEKTVFVHRLVASAFIPNPENKREVNHIDGNPSNNSIDNLEWVTRRENIDHAVANHLMCSGRKLGESHRAAPVAVYDLEGNFLDKFDCVKSASLKTGVGSSRISAVCSGRRETAGGFQWKHISKDEGVETKIEPVHKTSYRMGQLKRKEFDTFRNALHEKI